MPKANHEKPGGENQAWRKHGGGGENIGIAEGVIWQRKLSKMTSAENVGIEEIGNGGNCLAKARRKAKWLSVEAAQK
jgi:hypothetical protein